MMKERTTFAYRLRLCMDHRGLRVTDLARKSGLGKPNISQYLSGYNSPSWPNTCKLARALKVNPVWLAGYDDENVPDFLQGEDTKRPTATLLDNFMALNEEGQQLLLEYAEMLAASGRYGK